MGVFPVVDYCSRDGCYASGVGVILWPCVVRDYRVVAFGVRVDDMGRVGDGVGVEYDTSGGFNIIRFRCFRFDPFICFLWDCVV